MKKEQVYIDLQGKTKEELTDLWDFLKENNEDVYIGLSDLIHNNYYSRLEFWRKTWTLSNSKETKREITIPQLKQIIKPMGTFTPIAMKCTKEQFESFKPKLDSLNIEDVCQLRIYPYLINTYNNIKNNIGNVQKDRISNKSDTHETWNEEIFLKACGIEFDILQPMENK